MESEKACCPAGTARKMKKLVLPGGSQVGIVNLEGILRDVADLKIADYEVIRRELLQRVKIYNYVAAVMDDDYSKALLDEYKKLSGRQA